jgi:outer membrane receptor protein involved in Fe transport
MSRLIAAIVAACILLCASPALAASTGVVRGVITQAGKPQAGAKLILTGEGSSYSATTNAHGAYSFPSVTFGHYRLTVHVNGATDQSVDVDVAADAVATVNLELLKTIAVTAVTASGGAGGTPVAVTTIDKAQIATSPVNNSLNRLIETIPGAVQFSYNEPVINGFHGVTYEIDGAPLPLATTSNFAEIIDPKDIDSLEIFSGAIPAEFGGDRIGAVVNIITDRFEDVPEGTFGALSGGVGNQGQLLGGLDTVSRFGNNEVFLSLNNTSTNRGLDAPTFQAINDASSANDEFVRWVSKLSDRSTLAADYSAQFSQYQIPINISPNNPNDPIVAIPGTDDTQLEYDRFANLNFTQSSKDGNGVFQLIPWYRSTTVNYDGDLAADVQGSGPNFGCAPTGDSQNFPDCNADGATPNSINNVGLRSSTYANYVGVRVSQFRSSEHHAWKIGLDVNRENTTGSQTYACANVDCAISTATAPAEAATPANGFANGFFPSTSVQGQAGSQFGLYAQDKWQPTQNVSFDYGLRWDHSSGYTSGHMIEPRLGINVSDGGKNIAHVFYGRYYAAPLLEDVRQACVIFAAQNGCASGAALPAYNLQPERDSYFEIGLQHTFDRHLTGWVNVFEKNVVNILDTTQLLNTPLFAVFNNAIGIDQGVEIRLQDRTNNGGSWFYTATISGSYAAGISGSTFLFPPGTNPPGVSITSPSQLSLEDHSQTVDSTGGYTAHFGSNQAWFASLQANYGSGFPVQFEDANLNLNGTLPAHTTFDFSTGRVVSAGKGPDSKGLGVTLYLNNLLNHQYVIKLANGFNTTQIANGRTVLLKLTQPF